MPMPKPPNPCPSPRDSHTTQSSSLIPLLLNPNDPITNDQQGVAFGDLLIIIPHWSLIIYLSPLISFSKNFAISFGETYRSSKNFNFLSASMSPK